MGKSNVRFTGDWKKAKKAVSKLPLLLSQNLDKAFEVSAKELERTIHKAISRGDAMWPSLAPVTIQRKGHGRPLEEYGDLRGIIAWKKDGPYSYFIGVDKGKQNRFGNNLVKIMAVQEYGALIQPKQATKLAIPLTQEARALEFQFQGISNIPNIFRIKGKDVLYIRSGKTLTPMFILVDVVRVQPRPVLEPSMRKSRKGIQRRIKKAAQLAVIGRRYNG